MKRRPPFWFAPALATILFLPHPLFAAPPPTGGTPAKNSPAETAAAQPAPFSTALPSIPQKQTPEPLKTWESWALWEDTGRDCPRPYMDGKTPLCAWPSQLSLEAAQTGGHFTYSVTVYAPGTWVSLPGGESLWPRQVTANGKPAPVVEHNGQPALQLPVGNWTLEGAFPWNDLPQRIGIPRETGLLNLLLEGKPVNAPAWDASGNLWLKRSAAHEETAKDYLALKLYALLEDGNPLWLHTQAELVVSGKSREETLGAVVPEGWKISAVNSPIPVAVDDQGRVKAQVRAGKWTLHITAFRIDNPAQFRYAPGIQPAAKSELIAFRANPSFRMADLGGAIPIDVAQTTLPGPWRSCPVYRWDTAQPLSLRERLRGMGSQKPPGLGISRAWWLDENGKALTFRDTITGSAQQLWRLDAAKGQQLGSVRSGGQGQLITRNPQNGAPGVELRTRDLNLEATGRMTRASSLSATGWQASADSLGVTLNLPPGWRLFALFGADWVKGDWLTAWTLLDLFLLLIFSLAVGKLWGPLAGCLAFLAFGLAYHEPGAPRYLWFILLIPLALLRHVREGWGRRLLAAWKWLTVAALVLTLAPFVARQLQQALYPQLERPGHSWISAPRPIAAPAQTPMGLGQANSYTGGVCLDKNRKIGTARGTSSDFAKKFKEEPQYDETRARQLWSAPTSKQTRTNRSSNGATVGGATDYPLERSNLAQDAKARIQTGPGLPCWSWRTVSFGWNGPVAASQHVRPMLIPAWLERPLCLLRVALLLALAAVLLDARRWKLPPLAKPAKAALWLAAALAGFSAFPLSAQAQMPDKELLKTLRERLTEVSSAFPHAAEIPSATLRLQDRRLTLEAEIDAAAPRTAIPIPGRLASWSPLTVLVDGQPGAVLRRGDGCLWVALTQGVHQVRVEGLLGDVTEWEWTFQLKPRHVQIDAPGWNVNGVRPDGTPEQQIFFSLKQKTASAQASYDRRDYQTLALVERHAELGLLWQVHTTVSRLSPPGKAISLSIPLLPGENVLSSNAVVREGRIEANLGAHQRSFSWESELPVTQELTLTSRESDPWVERWTLEASPVWNVQFTGLAPVFIPGVKELIPTWQPWPGESVKWTLSRPEAVTGATLTVSDSEREIRLGSRQSSSKLTLLIRSSLAQDFALGLPPGAEIATLYANNQLLPARLENGKIAVPLQPGENRLALEWKQNQPLTPRTAAGQVTLPVESANAQTEIHLPANRWVLWAHGPQMGPAVRFWGVLAFALLAAWVLGRLPGSPLRTGEWMLLAVGLTQIPLPAALIAVAWFFALAWRGGERFQALKRQPYNLFQAGLVLLTALTLGILLYTVSQGLLGNPDMFIEGNGSHRTLLRWYQARCGTALPEPGCLTVSIWWYRLLMLAWALWLANALIRWLRWGWEQFNTGSCLRKKHPKNATPPPCPPASPE